MSALCNLLFPPLLGRAPLIVLRVFVFCFSKKKKKNFPPSLWRSLIYAHRMTWWLIWLQRGGGRVGGGRAAGKMFSSLLLPPFPPPSISQERACALPNIWSHVSAWTGSKGIRARWLKCLRVGGGTPLHFQASAAPSTKQCLDIRVWAHTVAWPCSLRWP